MGEIKKVYESYEEMVAKYKEDKWPNGSVVMLCPDHSTPDNKFLYIVGPEGYEKIPRHVDVSRVFRTFGEMVADWKKDKYRNTTMVMISLDHGGSEAGNIYVTTRVTYELMENINDGGGGGPVDTDPYVDLPPTVEHFDGLPKGSNINGLTVKQVVKKILYPYAPPTITISVQPNVAIQEKGTKIDKPIISTHVTRADKPITAVRFYLNGNLIHEITTGVEDGGDFSFTYNGSINSDSTFKVECDDGVQKPSASKTINYVNRAYYGLVPEGTDVDVVIVRNLEHSTLKLSKGLRWENIRVTGGIKHMVYAYPANQGALTSIVDQTNFQYIQSYTRTSLQINGEPYYVYKLTDASGPQGLLQVYS